MYLDFLMTFSQVRGIRNRCQHHHAQSFRCSIPTFCGEWHVSVSSCGLADGCIQKYMFDGMGIEWAMTLLGCVAAIFIPMPFVLYRYGKRIRAKSKFAPAPDIEQDKRRDLEARGAVSDSVESTGNGTSSGSDAKDLEKKEE